VVIKNNSMHDSRLHDCIIRISHLLIALVIRAAIVGAPQAIYTSDF
jgi:hypothetical protein